MDEAKEGLEVFGSIEYIPESFPEHELEPYSWRNILATLDVCVDIYATKHCNDKGYDIMSAYKVKVIQENEKLDTSTGSFTQHEQTSPIIPLARLSKKEAKCQTKVWVWVITGDKEIKPNRLVFAKVEAL